MFLLDTNILIYAVDKSNKLKHEKAKALLAIAAEEGKGVVSSQVVQEFCNVILKKFRETAGIGDLLPWLDEILLPLWQHFPSADFYKHSVQLCHENRLSFYDTLIIQAALDLGCDMLYSEDLQDGRTFGKLKIVNPFKEVK